MADLELLYPDIPFRLRLGVVADGSIDETKTAALIKDILSRIPALFDEASRKTMYEAKRTRLTFSVLTSLTKNAERSIVREILSASGASIEAILPGREDCLGSFDSDDARKEFEELLSKAARPVWLRSKSVGEEPDSIERAMKEAARYIVDHCDVLIAFSSDARAGEAIAYAKRKNRPVIEIPSSLSFSISRGHGLSAKSLGGIERFNSASVPRAVMERYIENVSRELFRKDDRIAEEAKSEAREKLLPFYVWASALAKRNQKLYRRAGTVVYTCSAISVASVALATQIESLSLAAFSVEFFLLAAILIIIWAANRRRTHKNWIESRYLAERVRSATFLAVCGAECSTIYVPPYMGAGDRSDDWVAMAFNEIWGGVRLSATSQESCPHYVAFIRRRWIRDQIKYHRAKWKRAERISHILERTGHAVFALALVAALLHILLGLQHRWHLEGLEKTLTFLAIALPALGASLGGIRAHREYSRLAKRSRNMTANLKRLNTRLATVRDFEELRYLLRETEELMMEEAQDWMMTMSFAKLEPPG
ncbi:MAG: hypothetical protein AB1631_03710 [Acidobacteriota bacterium]